MNTESKQKIREYISNLNKEEIDYITNQLSLVNTYRNLIKRYKLTKSRFCKLINIPLYKHKSYINGSICHTKINLAELNSIIILLEEEKIKEEIIKDHLLN